MDILKKHLVNIIFAVIALAAIVGTFWPLGGYFDKLKADVTERAGKYKTANDLYNKQHELPSISSGQQSGEQQAQHAVDVGHRADGRMRSTAQPLLVDRRHGNVRRRVDEVPIRAPCLSAVHPPPMRVSSASLGSSRAGTAAVLLIAAVALTLLPGGGADAQV